MINPASSWSRKESGTGLSKPYGTTEKSGVDGVPEGVRNRAIETILLGPDGLILTSRKESGTGLSKPNGPQRRRRPRGVPEGVRNRAIETNLRNHSIHSEHVPEGVRNRAIETSLRASSTLRMLSRKESGTGLSKPL